MNQSGWPRWYPLGRTILATLLLTLPLTMWGPPAAQAITASGSATGGCRLNSPSGTIRHLIYIQFDNTHFMRDNPNVPSDLEQMPYLLDFIRGNGVLLANHHTPLIAHTATDILTSLTGVYPSRHGVPVSNSFRYFNPDGSSSPGVSFAYWTDPIYNPITTTRATDTRFNMLTASGSNAPAPWVPFTRAGCNVGAVAMANTVLENIGTDIPTVFGATSPQQAEVRANPAQATADFVGIAVYCARGAALCASANGGEADRLPQEPGGYTGYMALFGHKYVAPQISPNGPLRDLDGAIIGPTAGHPGFPGFDGMSAAVSLGYVAAMQEHGIPVTYAYISDAHDSHTAGRAFGPGQAGYVAQLAAYNRAFEEFFTRLTRDGITPSNTLFVFTADEGDHFVGGPPAPARCDGVTTPCTYTRIGEINANLAGLLATQQGVTTTFTVHADAAPTFYLAGHPAPNAPQTRAFERAVANLTVANPLTGHIDRITTYLADPVEMKLLHMVTADPARTPTFTMFANPDYFLTATAPNCASPCVALGPAFAWNHGDVAPEINTTWLGLVGPGVRTLGVNEDIWSDHTDTRPTMLALLGLKDDYAHDGRVIFEVMQSAAIPAPLRVHQIVASALARIYKQIDAPVGALGLASLRISTAALASDTSGDGRYTLLEDSLAAITRRRDALAGQMSAMLEGAAFDGQAFQEARATALIDQGDALLGQVEVLAAGT